MNKMCVIFILAMLTMLAIQPAFCSQDFRYFRGATISVDSWPSELYYNAARHKLYCTVGGDTVLGVIDAAYSYSKIGGFGWETPNYLAYNQSRDVIYTCGTYDVFSVDCQTNAIQVVGAGLSEGFNGLIMNSANNRLYVYGGGMHVIDVAADTVLKSFPYEGPLFLYQPTNDVYAISVVYDTLFNPIDTLLMVLRDTTAIDSVHVPWGVTNQSQFAANEARGKIYITMPDSNMVAVMNAATHAFTNFKLTPSYPMKMTYCPATDEIYLACQNSDSMVVINCATDTISYIYLGITGESVTDLIYNSFIQKIYCADNNNGLVRVIDPASHIQVATVLLDTSGLSQPVDLAQGDSGKVFTANYWLGSVGVVAWQDTTIPYIQWTMPMDSAIGVPFDQPVRIYFSEAIDPASFAVTISPNPGGWSVVWDSSHTEATVQHAYFQPNTQFRCSVAVARDPWGNNLTGFRAWGFTSRQLDYLTMQWSRGRYQLFSVPLRPYDSLAVTLLGDNLGSYGQSNWRLFGYDPLSASTIELPQIKNGRGYWLSSVNNCTLDVSGYRWPTMGSTVIIHLGQGWNLIGHPFDFPFAAASCRVVDTTTIIWSDTLTNSTLRQRLWVYTDNSTDFVNNGAWDTDTITPLDPADSLKPWQGYAVYALRPCSLDIRTPISKGEAKGSPPPATIDWSLMVTARAGGAVDRVCLGNSPQAALGYDRLDGEKPPMVSDELLLAVPHPEWTQGPCHDYASDFRPTGGTSEWPLVLTLKNGGPALLEYQLSGALPQGSRLFLADRSSRLAMELSDHGTVAFDGSQELAVVLTDQGMDGLAFTPLAFGLAAPKPNPVRQFATINYQLTKPGPVLLEIYNVLGQKVGTLAEGYHHPGYYAARWSGTDGRGRDLPSGVYLVRLTAQGAQAVRKLVKVQ